MTTASLTPPGDDKSPSPVFRELVKQIVKISQAECPQVESKHVEEAKAVQQGRSPSRQNPSDLVHKQSQGCARCVVGADFWEPEGACGCDRLVTKANVHEWDGAED